MTGTGGGLLRLRPVDELTADPAQEPPGDALRGEFLGSREAYRPGQAEHQREPVDEARVVSDSNGRAGAADYLPGHGEGDG